MHNIDLHLAKKINLATISEIDRSKPLAFITGSFDLIHSGHMQMLAEIKAVIDCDVNTLVAVLDDTNIKERKGANRPIQSLKERVFALQSLRAVDYVIPWISHWSDLRGFVRGLRPDYLISVEGDSGIKNKSQLANEINADFILLKRNPKFSTTSLLKKIKSIKDEDL